MISSIEGKKKKLDHGFCELNSVDIMANNALQRPSGIVRLNLALYFLLSEFQGDFGGAKFHRIIILLLFGNVVILEGLNSSRFIFRKFIKNKFQTIQTNFYFSQSIYLKSLFLKFFKI